MKKESRECEGCGKIIMCEKTRLGKWVCSYECLEAVYGGEIPDKEDFEAATS